MQKSVIKHRATAHNDHKAQNGENNAMRYTLNTKQHMI